MEMDMEELFFDVFRIGDDSGTIDIGWNRFEVREFEDYLNEKELTPNSAQQARRFFIDYMALKTFQNGYGAGFHFELYEERRQEDLEAILSIANFSDIERQYFKKVSDFFEDDGSGLVPVCKKCDKEMSWLEDAKSNERGYESLCYSCVE